MKTLDLAQQAFPQTTRLRRYFHRHPEMAFKEVQTADFITQQLRKMGYETRSNIGGTGVIGLWQTHKPGPNILLRFDMDALPVQEATGHDFCSETPGIMHACGHDGHMAIGLTLAELIQDFREASGTYKFVFQPAEEIGRGALAMISADVLESPKPDYCLAIHLWAEKPFGWIGLTPGAVMAASSTFGIKIVGKGGHGARPQASRDPVLTACQIVLALQSIVSRNVPPFEPAVLSVTTLHGGSAPNVIPESVELGGTLRAFSEETNALLGERMKTIAEKSAEALGCQAEVTIQKETIPVVNDIQVVKQISAGLQPLLPIARIDEAYRTTISEDFGYFIEKIPGAMIFIGAGDEKEGISFPHHHPKFDINEKALWMGTAVLLQSCFELSKP